ncbi:apoptosis-associated speck-like protein containing a CARD [Sorex araneus]|uniref:apoptosis-associated speck-like protein containing a CARD n=1 Tax=Sorex araneus TaxID=42254 RepID=UPI002433E6B6|nr:apoptosis-associated speck-like protein containing a CARD [Sorex araneus]
MGSARDAILQALEELTSDELKKFKLKLQSVELREGYGRIPRGQLQSMDAVDLTDKIVSCYTEHYGAELTEQVLRATGFLEQADQLRDAAPADARMDPASAAAPVTTAQTAVHFVDRHRAELINRVTNVDALLDALYGTVLREDEYQAVRAEATNQNKMRKLYSLMPAWTLDCKNQLLTALQSSHPFLVRDLEKR